MIIIALVMFVMVLYLNYENVGLMLATGVTYKLTNAQNGVHLPGVGILWIILLGVIFLALGAVVFYIDSRSAMEVLRTGSKQYKPLSARIGDWYWNDTVNTNEYTFMTKFLWRFALGVVICVILMYLIGVMLILFSKNWAEHGVYLINDVLMSRYLLLGFAVSIVILIAEHLHRHERGFLDDYAVMQRQRRS